MTAGKVTGEAFADAVNARDEVGCLLPKAPLSAIPRRAIRESNDPCVVQRFVLQFFDGLAGATLNPSAIRIDFATPNLDPNSREGVRLALEILANRVSKPKRVFVVETI